MPTQLALRFEEVPVTDSTQARYHAIAPCLAGKLSAAERARALNLSYSTVARWLRQFRTEGMPGLFPASEYPREPYTPERAIVMLIYFKCCAPRASERELARVVSQATNERLHNETVHALLQRYFFWRYEEFRAAINYPVPPEPQSRRLEMVRLRAQGWSEQTVATLMRSTRGTVRKWVRRFQHEQEAGLHEQARLLDYSHAPHNIRRKVYFGTISAVLTLQKKYGYAGWFRIQGYLERDFGIHLGQTALKKVMRLNRRVHLAPQRPVELVIRDPREGPPTSRHPFEHAYIDIRYLDAKPEGVQLYSTLLLEGHSRTILAGSLTRRQDLGIVLRIYYLALLQWGAWEEVISDHGKQFDSHAFTRVNHRLQIRHTMYEKGHPWQNLIESQFGIQARLGEYQWARCPTVETAQEIHRELIRDHNRLPHFAHRKRNDNRRAPLEVLDQSKGREVDAATLHRAFSRMTWKRKTDERGFVRINRWKVYVEEGLPRTPVQVTYWDGKLRAEYNAQLLTEYRCKWDTAANRPQAINQPKHYETEYQSKQPTLFDPLWLRDPVEGEPLQSRPLKRVDSGDRQLRLYLGPELVKL